ncbi:ATP-binding protein [Haloarcula sp. 1CSR25-25]|uniref:sensor histidine kinase n=1 Tax=Haloarcula sp. 1CSR25-25 TaxID=2862545 RepID=UPI0028948FC7|nr:ATP-binding protein [Haloarcula sp. 1CSR25-25]MDT3437225.1 histidine kinase [Haloarcula sp. 1CSR25-25]
MSTLSPPLNPVFVAYVLLFGVSALACFASLPRARAITNDGTRLGLVALLVTSGGWSVAHLGFLLAPSIELKLAFYHAGLLVGLSTVGPWLYFCSAYTGRNLHKSTPIRWAAVAVFVLISLVKLTNPLHQRYFQSEVLATPFPHLSILSQELHWLAMGIAYALAVVGYFMLFELFRQVGHDTKPLFGLIGLTGLPIVLDALAVVSPTIINITYEPLGVAAFAVGVLFVFIDDFQTVQLTGQQDDPVLVLDDESRVRDFNRKAKELFPDLEVGEDIDSVLPEIAEYINGGQDDAVFELELTGGFKYYHLGVRPFTTDRSRLGTSVAFTDVTEREEYRRELERQNERLEQFASMVSHDLRNPLNVAQGRVEYLRGEDDSEHLAATGRALDRMEGLIEDVLALARQGQPIAERDRVTLSVVAKEAWAVVESDTATLTVDSDWTFIADSTRLQQLFENLFRNAIEHGGADVVIRVGALDNGAGFYIADDGVGIPVQDRERVLESGYSTASDGTGLGLSIVSEIAAAHDWQIDVTGSDEGGARFEFSGVHDEE